MPAAAAHVEHRTEVHAVQRGQQRLAQPGGDPVHHAYEVAGGDRVAQHAQVVARGLRPARAQRFGELAVDGVEVEVGAVQEAADRSRAAGDEMAGGGVGVAVAPLGVPPQQAQGGEQGEEVGQAPPVQTEPYAQLADRGRSVVQDGEQIQAYGGEQRLRVAEPIAETQDARRRTEARSTARHDRYSLSPPCPWSCPQRNLAPPDGEPLDPRSSRPGPRPARLHRASSPAPVPDPRLRTTAPAAERGVR